MGDFDRIDTTRDGWFWIVRHTGMSNSLASTEVTDWFVMLLDVEDDFFRRDVPVEHGVADRSAIACKKLKTETIQI